MKLLREIQMLTDVCWHCAECGSYFKERENGPRVDDANAVSPWLIQTDQSSAFFRVKAHEDE